MSPSMQPQGILGGIGKDAATVLAGSLDKLTAVLQNALIRGASVTFTNLAVKRMALSDGAVSFEGLSGTIEVKPL